jgi:hypothetical protein
VKRPRAVARVSWRANVTVTFRGTATVEAATEEEARDLIKSGYFEFDAATFDFDMATAEQVDVSDPSDIERDE